MRKFDLMLFVNGREAEGGDPAGVQNTTIQYLIKILSLFGNLYTIHFDSLSYIAHDDDVGDAVDVGRVMSGVVGTWLDTLLV